MSSSGTVHKIGKSWTRSIWILSVLLTQRERWKRLRFHNNVLWGDRDLWWTNRKRSRKIGQMWFERPQLLRNLKSDHYYKWFPFLFWFTTESCTKIHYDCRLPVLIPNRWSLNLWLRYSNAVVAKEAENQWRQNVFLDSYIDFKSINDAASEFSAPELSTCLDWPS